MAKIKKLKSEDGLLVYPATITTAVKDPVSLKTQSEINSEIEEAHYNSVGNINGNIDAINQNFYAVYWMLNNLVDVVNELADKGIYSQKLQKTISKISEFVQVSKHNLDGVPDEWILGDEVPMVLG